MKIKLNGFKIWLLAAFCQVATAHAQTTTYDELAQQWLSQGEVVMTPETLSRWAIERNAKTMAQRAQVSSVTQLVAAEEALYDPTLSLTTTRSKTKQKRSSEEISADVQRLISCGLDPECKGDISDLKLVNQQLSSVNGYGVQAMLPTGARLELMHSVQGNQTNMSDPINVMEARGTLTLTVSQPLLKGRGKDATEADLEVAKREYAVELQNLSRQVLDTLGSAVGAYWQLYQSEQSLYWRGEAVKMAEQAVDEVTVREQSGYSNKLELSDANVSLNARRIELSVARQQYAELQARIRNLLNLNGPSFDAVRFRTVRGIEPVVDAEAAKQLDEAKALAAWPSYRIAQLREEQERIRLRYADNQRQPDLSISLSMAKNNLFNSRKKAFEDVVHNKGEGGGWSLGISLSRPLGNDAAERKYSAQGIKVSAASDAVKSEWVAWSNEVVARSAQLKSTGYQAQAKAQAVALRQEALRLQREQFEAGRARMRLVLERQDQLSDSRLQAIEAQVNWKLAELQLLAVTGDVLNRFGIDIQTR
jgi:outer membrane protein TolC